MSSETQNLRLFLDASGAGDLNEVKRLLPGISDINAADERGWNAMIRAAFNHHRPVVEFLLSQGGDINSTNRNGTTVFMYAKTKVLENENYVFLDYLLSEGADLNRRDKKRNWTVLDYAMELKNEKLIDYIRRNNRAV